jgi:hypothetical protein
MMKQKELDDGLGLVNVAVSVAFTPCTRKEMVGRIHPGVNNGSLQDNLS